MNFYKILYLFTVYLPLRIRDLFVNFLALLMRRDLVIDVAYRLLREKGLIGVLPDGNLISYPLDDFKLLSIISEIYHKRIYDVEQMKGFRCIYDIGAHIGLFTLRISKEAPNSKIIAIEPNPINFKFLLKNIAINGLKDRIPALNVAIGKRKEKAVLLLSKISGGNGSIKKWHNSGAAGSLIVDVIPLDNVLLDERICDLIKIDVEGAESEVLKGLENQYKKVNRLIVEIHTSIVDASEICEWLRYHGFVITRRQKLYTDCLLLEGRRPCT